MTVAGHKPRQRPLRLTLSTVFGRVTLYGVLIAIGVLFLLPIYWMAATAFRPQSIFYEFPPEVIVGELTLNNFRNGWDALPFGRFFFNSFVVTVLSVVGTVLSSSLIGFGFARYTGRGYRLLFISVLATMMIPPAVTLIPKFVLFSRLDWIDTYYPLIVPTFFGVPFFIFLFRQFFRTIPREYFDAAELDGASPLEMFWSVAVPMSRPVFVAAALFATLTAWNDFQDPLVYITSLDKYTIQLGLAMFRGQNYTDFHLMMPMALLAMIPVLVLVFAGQRYIARGLIQDTEK